MEFNSISFRPIEPGDEPFLYSVYHSTRQDELAVTGWTEQQINEFTWQQFTMQHKFYQDKFGSAKFLIISSNGQDLGRLYREVREDEIRIIDIALLPEYRSKGIGTKLLTDILAEATGLQLAVRIHVEKDNPALRLYDRLGFKSINDAGVYWLLEWRPQKGG